MCGGFETKSWSRGFTIPRSDPVEAVERLLDRMEEDASTVCSDTSSEVDPRLEEELECMLKESPSDGDSEPEEDSKEEEDFEDDVVEKRLCPLHSRRVDGMKQRLCRWEREEAVSIF